MVLYEAVIVPPAENVGVSGESRGTLLSEVLVQQLVENAGDQQTQVRVGSLEGLQEVDSTQEEATCSTIQGEGRHIYMTLSSKSNKENTYTATAKATRADAAF